MTDMFCSICLEKEDDYKDEEWIMMFCCHNPFHKECLKKWLKSRYHGNRRNFCPICRSNISEEIYKHLNICDTRENV